MSSFVTTKNNPLDPEKMQEAGRETFPDLDPCGANRWLVMWLGSALQKKSKITSQSLKKGEQCCEPFLKALCKFANIVTLYTDKNFNTSKECKLFFLRFEKMQGEHTQKKNLYQHVSGCFDLWNFSSRKLWENPFTLYDKNHQSSLILNGRNWLLFRTTMLNCNKDVYKVSTWINYYLNK